MVPLFFREGERLGLAGVIDDTDDVRRWAIDFVLCLGESLMETFWGDGEAGGPVIRRRFCAVGRRAAGLYVYLRYTF